MDKGMVSGKEIKEYTFDSLWQTWTNRKMDEMF
jgi:hypothetical protein